MNIRISYVLFLLFTTLAFGQDFTINGTVVDEGNIPIPGVNVIVKGTSNGANTDFDGNFSIDNVSPNATIAFTYLGYKTKEVTVTGSETLNIILQEDIAELDAVVVIGYGTQRKELVSGAYTSLTTETINESNPTRVEEALQGSAAGVQVNANSGSPGSSLNIRIRGITTNGDNSPLVIVDGVNIGPDLSIVDPNDIATMDIIKDASTAIYGVQGANGVILITTKKGRKGTPTKFNYNSYYAFQEAANQLDLMNATEYAVYVNETEAADGNPIPFPSLEGLGEGTNWQRELFGTAPMFNHNLSATGASEKLTYGFSGSYFGQEGVIAPEKSFFNRWTLKNNLGIDLTEKLKLNTFLLYTNIKRRTIPEGGRGSTLYYALNAAPTTPIFDGTDGSGPSRGFSYLNQGIEIINPFALINNTFNDTKVNRFTGKVELVYDLIEDMKVTSRYNFNYADVISRAYFPLQFYGPSVVNNNVTVENDQFVTDTNDNGERDVFSTVNENTQTFFDYTWESFIDYKKSFGNHNFDFLLGTSLRSAQFDGFFVSEFLVSGPDSWDNAFIGANTQAVIDDEFITVGTDDNGQPIVIDNSVRRRNEPTVGRGEDRWYSAFGRVQYNYKSKYLFSGMLRRDASTRFGPNNRIGYFPSFSGGWVVDKEDFFDSNFINKLKVRGSWGITGNDKIGSYRWLGFLQGISGEATYPFGDVLAFGNAIGPLANPDLKWETNFQKNIGLDVSFFDSMLNLTVDYYEKRTEDLLLIPEISGLAGPTAGGSSPPFVNAGTIENKGIDLSLNFNYDFSENLKMGIGYNLTTVKNNTIEVSNPSGFFGGIFGLSQPTSIFRKGLPIGTFIGYKTDGIFQNQAEIDAHATQLGAQPGDIRYVDIDGDGVIEFGDDDDLTVLGNPIPDVTMGFNFNLDYKSFDFSTSLYASIGNDVSRSYERFLPDSNRLRLYLDRWTGEGTSNTVPRASTNAANNRLFSDFFVEDGSYLRIQNIQLGYSLPSSVLEKTQIDKLRIYFAINNLYTFTKYRGYNPF